VAKQMNNAEDYTTTASQDLFGFYALPFKAQ
jgi:hypothetical protein